MAAPFPGFAMSFLEQMQEDLALIFSDDELTEGITYVSQDGRSFPCSAICSQVSLEKLISSTVVGDSCECRILHSALLAGGIQKPTIHRERSKGDCVIRNDLSGHAITWNIIDSVWSATGTWKLLLECNVKVVPR